MPCESDKSHPNQDYCDECSSCHACTDEYISELKQKLTTTKQESLAALEEALKAMLINGFSEDCVPVVKVKYQIKKLME